MPNVSRLALACSFVVCVCAIQAQTPTAHRLAVTDALNLYDRGNYPEFFVAIRRDGAVDQNLFKTFESDANRWLKAPATSSERHRFIAATVALEIAHLLRDEPADRASRYLFWASQLVRKSPPATPSMTEHLWYLASAAGMEELEEPWSLTAGFSSPSPVLRDLSEAMGRGGHLAVASRRFPDEPRFQLAGVAAQEYRLMNGRDISFAPSLLEFGRVFRSDMTDAITVREVRNEWAEIEQWNAQVPDVARAYLALGSFETLGGEIELHVGYLESVAQNWSSALNHLRRVPALTDEAYLRYLSQYFIGRTFHYMGIHGASVDAFQRAAAIEPNARSAASLLAAEYLLSDSAADRDRAYPLLQAAHSDSAPGDPWRLYRRADARLWPTYMAQLRQALR